MRVHISALIAFGVVVSESLEGAGSELLALPICSGFGSANSWDDWRSTDFGCAVHVHVTLETFVICTICSHATSGQSFDISINLKHFVAELAFGAFPFNGLRFDTESIVGASGGNAKAASVKHKGGLAGETGDGVDSVADTIQVSQIYTAAVRAVERKDIEAGLALVDIVISEGSAVGLSLDLAGDVGGGTVQKEVEVDTGSA